MFIAASLPPFLPGALRRCPLLWSADGSALVEEPTLGDAGLVLRRDIDVSRRQKEHLLRHPLDASMQAEDQSSREVYEALGVDVVHLGQIHDHRGAFAEMLPDGARLVVCARVQRGDAVGLAFG